MLEPDATTPAAFVSLVVRDSAGVVIARSQTTSSGRFSVQLGGGGTFRLRALRIGYLPTDTSFSTARAGDVVTLRLILSMRRVVLAPVTVAERNRCADASAGNGALVGIWEQVSATLDATSRSGADEALAVETISYTASQRSRDRAPSALAVEPHTWRRGGSFQSAEARDLVEHGFLRIREGELEFLAPDARVLIDSAFMREYCLSPRAGPPNREGWQGIGFRHPRPPGHLVTVEGVLWVDADARLRMLEYRFRGLAGEVEKVQPGGTVHFRELPNHQWIVSRWRLRMAETVVERLPTGVRAGARLESVIRVRGVVERGGVAVRVRIGDSPAVAIDAFPATVHLEGARSALPDVAVWSISSDDRARLLVQDQQGVVHPSHATPGSNRFLVWTSLMRALGLPPDTSLVLLRPVDDSLAGTIRIPDEKIISRRLCATTRGAVAVGARPTERRTTLVLSQAHAYPRSARRYDVAYSDTSSTQWRACGLPRNESLVLWSERDGVPWVHSRFRIPAGIDIALISGNSDSPVPTGSAHTSTARTQFVVLSARDSTPLAGVRATVSDTLDFFGDSRGTVRMPLMEGTYAVLVRRLGYVPATITLDAGQGRQDTLFLEPIPVTLSEVKVRGRNVTAPARYADVLRRAASNAGTLFTREDLAGTNDLRTLLGQIPGIQVSDRGISMQRCQGGMPSPGHAYPEARIQVYIDGVRVTTLPDSNAVMASLRLVHASSIELVEVYRGVAQIPGEFLNDACAVIAIWTKSY